MISRLSAASARMLNRCRILLCTLFLAATLNATAHAEVKILKVDPNLTDPAIEAVHGPHLALYDPEVSSNHRLFLYFVGTGVHAEGGLAIGRSFARLGYHVIALDYENKVLAASCVHSSDSSCFDSYRAAIVSGAPGSDKVHVEPSNSILNRFDKLLAYLVKEDAGGGWGEFVAEGKPVWRRVVLAGHSQGSGHAAYIAKLYEVDKVLMFSGPQDYLSDLDKPAPWESRPSATPPSRFYAFLNVNDPFNESHQIASCEALMHASRVNPFKVEPGQALSGVHQILITDVDPKHAHGTTVSPQFENVWDYLGTVDEHAAKQDGSYRIQPMRSNNFNSRMSTGPQEFIGQANVEKSLTYTIDPVSLAVPQRASTAEFTLDNSVRTRIPWSKFRVRTQELNGATDAIQEIAVASFQTERLSRGRQCWC